MQKNSIIMSKFYIKVKKDLLKNGFQLKALTPTQIKNRCGEYIEGYFSEDEKVIIVDKTHPLSFEILVHEYCHFLQWKENAKAFFDTYQFAASSDQIVQLWLDHEIELSEKQINKHVNLLRNLEYDCEKRSIQLIKDLSLPIDIKQYTKMANVYLDFYEVLKISRQWYPQEEQIYLNTEILSTCKNVLHKTPNKKTVDKIVKVLLE